MKMSKKNFRIFLLRNGDSSLNIFLFVVVLIESYILSRKKLRKLEMVNLF